MANRGTWINGKRKISGWWDYSWASDTFYIELDQKDRITGDNKHLILYGNDKPEWGNWKLLKEQEK